MKGKQMDYKPDYGYRLLKAGVSVTTNLTFANFRLYSLTVLGRNKYSTMVEMPYADEMHALSLDFNERQLDLILAKATPSIHAFLKAQLLENPATPRTIDFDGMISFGVTARLGRPCPKRGLRMVQYHRLHVQ